MIGQFPYDSSVQPYSTLNNDKIVLCEPVVRCRIAEDLRCVLAGGIEKNPDSLGLPGRLTNLNTHVPFALCEEKMFFASSVAGLSVLENTPFAFVDHVAANSPSPRPEQREGQTEKGQARKPTQVVSLRMM